MEAIYLEIGANSLEEILRQLQEVPGQVGFCYKNLDTGETQAFQEDLPLVAASVIKIPVLVEVFRQMEAGVLSPEEPFVIGEEDKMPSCGALTYMHTGLAVTLEDLYTLMIIHSDNTATNLLIKKVGIEAVNGTMRSLGLERSVLRRLLFDQKGYEAGINNHVTAGEMALLLEKLYRGEVVSPAASTKMLELLRTQRLNGKIPFALPPKTPVAHKTGEDGGITHDVGIIWGGVPFIACFLSNEVEVPAFERLIQDMSRRLYDLSFQ